MTYLFFDIFGISMLWGIQNQLRVFLRALLGQQVPQHDVKWQYYFFYHHVSEGRGIFTIGKCGAKFKILKCSKQTLSPFPHFIYLLYL
jgi:hypothetical protein